MEAAAALGLAAGGASALGSLQAAAVRALRWALPSAAANRGSAAARAAVAAVAAAGLIHPAAAALCGCICLAVRLAAGSKHATAAAAAGDERSIKAASGHLASWLVFHGQLALLPCASLYSWLAGGMQHTVEWSDGRLLVVALALHAASLRPTQPEDGSGSQADGGSQRWRASTLAAVHEAAAAAAAAASLWGHPYVLVYAACWSAAVEGPRAGAFA